MPFELEFSASSTNVAVETSSASRRGTHQLLAPATCERHYGMRYVWGLRTTGEPPWRFVGTLIHELLAFHYAARCDTPPKWYVGKEAWTPAQQIDAIGAMQQPAQRQTALDYYRYYENQMVGENLHPIYVEEEFLATIGELDPGGPFPELDGEIISCRSDLVGMVNGDLLVYDHKCGAGEWNRDRLPTLPVENEYTRSLQIRNNLLLVGAHQRRLGLPEPQGFVIQRLKRKPPFDVARDPIEVPAGALEDAGRTLRMLVRRELSVRAQFELDPWSVLPNDSQCVSKYGPCDFLSICNAPRNERQELVRLEYGRDVPS